MKTILSIDGGGIKGIIPGMVLVELEERLKQRTGNPNTFLADYFDYFAGTSTGGILICLILCPSKEDPKKPRFTAREALNLYIENGSKIFESKGVKKFFADIGWVTERYDATVLEDILLKYFEDVKLSELIRPCLITAYNIELRKAHFFRQRLARIRGDQRDFFVRDVCRATSAAPTYFSVAEIHSLSGVRYPLLDGGIFATNPSLSAFVEIKREPEELIPKDIYILSLGTGVSKRSYDSDELKDTKALFVVPALLDMMMGAATETSHFYMKQIFSFLGIPDHYVRLEPLNLQSVKEQLDAASPRNIDRLMALADRMISQRSAVIDIIVDNLIKLKLNQKEAIKDSKS
ncbi:MAG: patatin-like phospholipase family protein [Bacteroidetes bacterium]|nr:patatin-like phospholipase family protein [Bacteroidota bacterium]MBU1373628.1 patatin-like phospholipase family protein [Bacteroidota bacterium]MBU1485954.1 patatin-like phospholipase family protein [Bacteroidota bacterium]MBU1759549.1 patatin-like phospholipase family protein [Bacteroidota bacterium]MBU2267896.1 patatin-like phospholipase family protein [Bacteroidota bacterium]